MASNLIGMASNLLAPDGPLSGIIYFPQKAFFFGMGVALTNGLQARLHSAAGLGVRPLPALVHSVKGFRGGSDHDHRCDL